MPELPDVLLYLDALRPRVVGHTIRRIRIFSPFVLRSVDPPIESAEGTAITAISRLGKRFVFELDDDLFLVIHLMIGGRFRWKSATGKSASTSRRPGKIDLAAIELDSGALTLTEASQKKRASIHMVQGRDKLAQFSRGGIDPLSASFEDFRAALTRERHTLKRALTDPRLFDGIGNAYSDEILHAARLSPFKRSDALGDEEQRRLHDATRHVLSDWTDRLREQFDGGRTFPGPGQITAFRPDFAAHGKFNQPCPVCNTPIQRVVFADKETNYCPSCQTEGRVLADRSLSRLLKDDWPRTIEDLHDDTN